MSSAKTFVAKLSDGASKIKNSVSSKLEMPSSKKIVTEIDIDGDVGKESYFKLDGAQYAIIIGIALSAMMSFVQIYNAISKINDQEKNDLREETKAALQTRFVVMIVMACLAIAAGIGLGIYFREGNEYQMLAFSLVFGGVASGIYALVDKYDGEQWMTYTKMGLSLSSLFAFVLLGYLYQTGNSTVMSYIKKYK